MTKRQTVKNTDKRKPNSQSLPSRARQAASRRYFRVMPNKKLHRTTIWWLFWIASGIILAQLIYPLDRVLPTATLLGQPKAWSTQAEITADMQQLFGQTTVELVAGDSRVKVPLKNFGAAADTVAMTQRVTDYPLWQRYIPLSIFMRQPNVDSLTLTYTNLVAQTACRQYAKQLSSQPVNAQIAIENNQLVATDEQPGRQVDSETLCRDIQTADITLAETNTINVRAKLIEPVTTADDLASVRTAAEAALDSQVEFTHGGDSYRPDRATIASWLKIGGTAKQPELVLAEDKLKQYLENLNQTVGQPAGTTNVSIVDGVEISRSTGKPGQIIDYQAAIAAVRAQLIRGDASQPIDLTLNRLSPRLVYNNRYTNSQAGLRAYVADAARQYNAQISIRQLNGEGWQAAARQNESWPSASTYKLYVAMWLFDEMKAGRVTWDAPILGTTVSDCFNQMTIASTNPCSLEWLARAGRDKMNQYVYSKGFSKGTTFTHPLATHTTAADLTNYMTRLAEGSLYADIYRQRLYHSLKTHPYRYGIPTGSAGQVYDKVGFLWDYVHDTAIVEHPKGKYVMTIMTKGQSYSRIAGITREVERIMYGQ